MHELNYDAMIPDCGCHILELHGETPQRDAYVRVVKENVSARRRGIRLLPIVTKQQLLQLPQIGIPEDVHGLVIICSYCGCIDIVTGITDPVNRAEV